HTANSFSVSVILQIKFLFEQDCHDGDGDENPVRGNWTNKTEYTLTLIGYAIGLGNIWRFPYITYKNGGGAFLIPYFLLLVLCGIPIFLLENAIGQFCSQGPINIWKALPMLQGVGFSVIVMNAFVVIYYNVIIAYGLYYMFASFQSPLPWSSCFSWADSNCSSTPRVSCNVSGVLVANWTQENITCPETDVITDPVQSPSEQYWDRVVLQRSSGLDETGPVVWHLALCLLLSSILVAAALIRGIKSSGKVVYLTATVPYVLILILLIRGTTLEGAMNGIEFYIGSQSNFTKLTDQQVWKDAATQTFFSLSLCTGGITTLASYNNFHNNMVPDSIVVPFINHGSSIFAGFAIFSILGHMSLINDKPVEHLVKEGFGLAFIAYPDALAKLPVAPLWSVLFFSMIFMVGLDSQFTMIEVLITNLCDAFPESLRSKRAYVNIGTCVVVFLLGLPCVTRAGIYWVNLLDQLAGSWVLLCLCLMEIIGFCYVYGANCLIKDIEMMIGKKSVCFWLWWKTCWLFITPFIVILFWSLTSPSFTNGDVQYPAWGMTLYWCMVAFILIWIPVVFGYNLYKAEGSLWKRLKSLLYPTEDWHPYMDIHRGERYSIEACRLRRTLSTNDKQM
uniref:Transporter n=1 Tax=Scophthalmus maximus TaxID=52904 RepID=A0A8D2ZXI3_SCOMX